MDNSSAIAGGSSIYSEKEIQSKRNINNFFKFSLVFIILVLVSVGIYFISPYLTEAIKLYTVQNKVSPTPTPFPTVNAQMDFLVKEKPKDEQGIGVMKIGEKQFNLSGTVIKINQQEITLSIKGENVAIGLDTKTLYASRPKLVANTLSGEEKFAFYKKISREEIAIGQEAEILADINGNNLLIARVINILL